jgi:hypothetical protein
MEWKYIQNLNATENFKYLSKYSGNFVRQLAILAPSPCLTNCPFVFLPINVLIGFLGIGTILLGVPPGGGGGGRETLL